MPSFSRFLLATAAACLALAGAVHAETAYYVDWISAQPQHGMAYGVVKIPLRNGDTQVIQVDFEATSLPHGIPVPILGAQIGCNKPPVEGGQTIDYWQPAAPFISEEISNAPSNCQILRLVGTESTRYTVRLSATIENPLMAILSLGSAGDTAQYDFDSQFKLLMPKDPDTMSYFGGSYGNFFTTEGTQLAGQEGSGTIQFQGHFSSFSWVVPDPETFHGFTFGFTTTEAKEQLECPMNGKPCECLSMETPAGLIATQPTNGNLEGSSISFTAECEAGGISTVATVHCRPSSTHPPPLLEWTALVRPVCSSASVVGDPQFIGLRGQNYQVHGVSGEIYNIVSDADLQYNSRFVFLHKGACPVVNGRKQKGCFSHPGSYLGELGLKTRAGDRVHVVAGAANKGFASITLNNRSISVGESVELKGDLGVLSRNSTHLMAINVGEWSFIFENSDLYVNQRVRVQDARKLRSHGLLGQTWRDATYPTALKFVQGVADDYVIRDGDIFGDSFVYNAFN